MRAALPLLVVGALVRVAAAASCAPGVDTNAFLAPTHYGVGVRTLSLVDTTRITPPHDATPELPQRTLDVEVWYPAEAGPPAGDHRDAPPAGTGPFPLVVNSPGLLDIKLGEAYYARLLASRGYIVASITFPSTSSFTPDLTDLQRQPGDVSFVIDRLVARQDEGGVDAKRIGVSGLSLGGMTTVLVTYHPKLRDRRVRAALAIAPAGGCAVTPSFFRAAHPPLLVLGGDQDLLVPFEQNGGKVFKLSRSPRTLVTLVHGSHVAFTGVISSDSTISYDKLGCAVIADVAQWGDPFTGLTGPGTGLSSSNDACLVPCQTPVPPNPPMQASEQHRLTSAIVAAFFDATLRHSADARCFLRRQLAHENTDLTVKTRGGR